MSPIVYSPSSGQGGSVNHGRLRLGNWILRLGNGIENENERPKSGRLRVGNGSDNEGSWILSDGNGIANENDRPRSGKSSVGNGIASDGKAIFNDGNRIDGSAKLQRLISAGPFAWYKHYMVDMVCNACGCQLSEDAHHNRRFCVDCAKARTKQQATARQRRRRDDPELRDKYLIAQKKHYRKHVAKYLIQRAQKRAKSKGIPFNLEDGDIAVPATCPVLGFDLHVGDDFIRDDSPTLDRITPQAGYVRGNVVVISKKANAMKNNGTLEEHRKLVTWMESCAQTELQLSE